MQHISVLNVGEILIFCQMRYDGSLDYHSFGIRKLVFGPLYFHDQEKEQHNAKEV